MNDNAFDVERRTGIGGSDAAAVLGISPWQTPFDVYRQKRGEVGPLAETPQMRWGKLLEPVILEEYARLTGNALFKPPMRRHPTHEFMIAHIDACIDDKRIVEVKTARVAAGFGEAGSDEVPMQYLAQCQHYLCVSNSTVCDLAVLIGGSDFRVYQINRDSDIQRELVRREAEFWWRVEHGEPPDPIDLPDALNRWRRVANTGAVTATARELIAFEALQTMKATRARLDEAEADAKFIIVSALADKGDTLIDGPRVLATFKMDRGRRAYMVEPRPPSRRLILKDSKL